MFKKLKNKYVSLPLPVKAGFWFFICNLLQKGISVISTPIFTRLFTTAEYGRFGIFSSWLEILGIFFTLKLSAGVYVQGLVKHSEDRENFTLSLEVLTTLLIVFYLCIYISKKVYFEKIFGLTESAIYCIFISSWASAIFGFWSARNRVDYKYKSLVAVTVITTVLKPVTGIISVLAFPNCKVEARIITLAVVEFICYVGLFFKTLLTENVRLRISYWKYALTFNVPLIPHYLSQTVLNQSDRLMIKYYNGDSHAGIYSLAHSLSWMMVLINNAIRNVLDPWVYQNIKNNKVEKIGSVSYFLLILVAIVNYFLTAIAPEAVVIFAGVEYYEAIWVIPPLCISVYFMFLYSLFATFEFYYEKTFFMTVASISGALLNLLLNYIFIDLYGYIAAGYTTMICYGFYCVAHYFMMRRICRKFLQGIRVYNLILIIGISVAFMLLCFLTAALYNNALIRYGIILILIIILFLNKNILKNKLLILKERQRK